MKVFVRNYRDEKDNIKKLVIYWCQGCGHVHGVDAERWHWNGSTDSPTLQPSVRHYIPASEDGTRHEKTTCHYNLRDGVIEYGGDCDHELKGQNVPLQEIPVEIDGGIQPGKGE